MFQKIFKLDKVPDIDSTCQECTNRELWGTYTEVYHFCKARKCVWNANGLLRVECQDKACNLFEKGRK